jgi:hypothetical protein
MLIKLALNIRKFLINFSLKAVVIQQLQIYLELDFGGSVEPISTTDSIRNSRIFAQDRIDQHQ